MGLTASTLGREVWDGVRVPARGSAVVIGRTRERARFGLAAALVGIALGCASRNGPVYPEFAASAPPIPAGQARLVVYRTLDTEPQVFHAQISVDGGAVGTLPMGTWLWVDRPAGLHRIDSPPWPAYSAFGDQAPTRPVDVELAPGSVGFVAVNLVTTGRLEVRLQPIDPTQARQDLATLEMAPPTGSR